MNKYGIYNKDGELYLVFTTEAEAISNAILYETDWVKLIPNRWWIDSDWTDEDGNFILECRNPEVAELKELISRTGLNKKKIAEMAGVVPSTVFRWCNGTTPVPTLVLEKLRRIDAAINEK